MLSDDIKGVMSLQVEMKHIGYGWAPQNYQIHLP